MTSQGAHINGLDARKWISAGYACHTFGGSKRSYIKPAYEQKKDISTPVVDITNGTTTGFRYLQFGNNAPKSVSVVLGNHECCKINVRIDSYNGRIISTLDFSKNENEKSAPLAWGLIGKHAVYFEFILESGTAEFDRFTFD